MKYRLLLVLPCFALLGWGAYELNEWIQTQGWAVLNEQGKWGLADEGWYTFKRAWPLFVAGFFAFMPFITLTVKLFNTAEQADHRNTVSHLQKQLNTLDQETNEKYSAILEARKSELQRLYKEKVESLKDAEKTLQNRSERLTKSEHSLEAQYAEFDMQVEHQNQQVKIWQDLFEEFESEKDNALRKSRNAQAAAERYKRKAERLKKQLEKIANNAPWNPHHKM